MQFYWISEYTDLLIDGMIVTLQLLLISVSFGFALGTLLAMALMSRNIALSAFAKSYCLFFRGTPLLIQLWLLYYGVGSLLPGIPGLKSSFLWPVLREGYFFAAVGLTLNYAAYHAVVMRGALLSVPRGELEAGRAFGMSPVKLLWRIWLPRAIRISLPTIAGEVVLQMKSTPLVFSITVMDLYSVAYKVRQDTYLVYEPLIAVAVFYFVMTVLIEKSFAIIEGQVPIKR